MVSWEHDDDKMLFQRSDPRLSIETVHLRLLSTAKTNLYSDRGWAELKRRQPALKLRNMKLKDFKIESDLQGLPSETVTSNIRTFLIEGCPSTPARLRVVKTNDSTIARAGLNMGVELGAQAASRLQPCDVVCEYTGMVCTEEELAKCEGTWGHGDGRYAFMLPGLGRGNGNTGGTSTQLLIEGGLRVEREEGDRSNYYIATCPGGTVNSPLGLAGSPEANVCFVNIVCGGFDHCKSQGQHFHTFMVAKSNICATENLLVDYGGRYHNELLGSDEPKQDRKGAAAAEDDDEDDYPIIEVEIHPPPRPAPPRPPPTLTAVKHESSGPPPLRAVAVAAPPDADSKREAGGDGSGSSGEGCEAEPASAKRARLSPPLPAPPLPSQAEIAEAAAEVVAAQQTTAALRPELQRLTALSLSGTISEEENARWTECVTMGRAAYADLTAKVSRLKQLKQREKDAPAAAAMEIARLTELLRVLEESEVEAHATAEAAQRHAAEATALTTRVRKSVDDAKEEHRRLLALVPSD